MFTFFTTEKIYINSFYNRYRSISLEKEIFNHIIILEITDLIHGMSLV